jgi:hypothetical protein
MHNNPVMDAKWLEPPHKYVKDVGAGLAACTPIFAEICTRRPKHFPDELPAGVFEMFEIFTKEGAVLVVGHTCTPPHPLPAPLLLDP